MLSGKATIKYSSKLSVKVLNYLGAPPPFSPFSAPLLITSYNLLIFSLPIYFVIIFSNLGSKERSSRNQSCQQKPLWSPSNPTRRRRDLEHFAAWNASNQLPRLHLLLLLPQVTLVLKASSHESFLKLLGASQSCSLH